MYALSPAVAFQSRFQQKPNLSPSQLSVVSANLVTTGQNGARRVIAGQDTFHLASHTRNLSDELTVSYFSNWMIACQVAVDLSLYTQSDKVIHLTQESNLHLQLKIPSGVCPAQLVLITGKHQRIKQQNIRHKCCRIVVAKLQDLTTSETFKHALINEKVTDSRHIIVSTSESVRN